MTGAERAELDAAIRHAIRRLHEMAFTPGIPDPVRPTACRECGTPRALWKAAPGCLHVSFIEPERLYREEDE